MEKGRQQKLHLLAAGQHLEQISDELRKLLLSSCALRVFFRLGPDDAMRAGKWLATGTGSRPLRIALGVDKNAPWDGWRHELLDPWGKPVALGADDWETFQSVQESCRYTAGEDLRRVPALRMLLEGQGVPRLYVRAADTGAPVELAAYVKGLPAAAYTILGPNPLQLAVSFPRPKVTIMGTRGEAERAGLIAQALMQMPPQEAVVVTDTGEKAQVRTVPIHFPDDLPPIGPYLGGQDQTAAEMAQTERTRRAGIEALSRGLSSPSLAAAQIASVPAARARSGDRPTYAPTRRLTGTRSAPRETQGAGSVPTEPQAAADAPAPQPSAPRIARPEVADDGTI